MKTAFIVVAAVVLTLLGVRVYDRLSPAQVAQLTAPVRQVVLPNGAPRSAAQASTAYPIADNVRFPADAHCVEARRPDGWYRYCDTNELGYIVRLSVADLLRTGRVAGERVE